MGGRDWMSKAKKEVFSVTKAVKANARERVGSPPPEVIIPDDKSRAARRTSKHKETLEKMLQREEEA
jgi:protein-arginine kinase activator protein McsA